MIQPLRTLHRRTFYVMALIVPTIFIVGIRHQDQQSPHPSPRYAALKGDEAHWPSGLLATRSDRQQITIHVLKPLRVPDPLLYCAPSTSKLQDLPDEAVLLGPVRDGGSLPASCNDGSLVLYSLGHRAIVDQLLLEVTQ
jgi:hypothetical protein